MLTFRQVEELLYSGNVLIESNKLFKKCADLASKAEPNLTYGENDKRWLYFYFPVRLDRELPPAKDFALIPFALIWLNDRNGERYYIAIKTHSTEIRKGSQNSEIHESILDGAKKILPELNEELLEEHVPYLFREGKVKRKYVEKPELSKKEAEEIIEAYKGRSRKAVYPISLKDYLKTAGYCLRAIFPEKAQLSDRELYEQCSDFRRAGMLDLPENDPKAFTDWYNSDAWKGTHPFEILHSSSNYGLELLPPIEDRRRYVLSVGSELLYSDYIKAVRALIENGVSFEAPELRDVLAHLTGKAYLPVNKSYDSIKCDGTEPFAKHVKWEPLKLPKLKL